MSLFLICMGKNKFWYMVSPGMCEFKITSYFNLVHSNNDRLPSEPFKAANTAFVHIIYSQKYPPLSEVRYSFIQQRQSAAAISFDSLRCGRLLRLKLLNLLVSYTVQWNLHANRISLHQWYQKMNCVVSLQSTQDRVRNTSCFYQEQAIRDSTHFSKIV